MMLQTVLLSLGLAVLAEGLVTEDTFGWLPEHGGLPRREVKRYTLTSSSGASVQVINYGATITTIKLPDRYGNFTDINMGFDNIEGYIEIGKNVNPYFGATIGRVANRVGGARFTLNDHVYNVSANVGDNQLHGGFQGFDKKLWTSHVQGERVTMSYLSGDLEEGYPGQVLAHVTYWMDNSNELHVQILATSTKPTPVNIVNHAYFNLAGHGAGPDELYEHEVTINADAITPAVDTIPTGEIKSVRESVFDLRSPKKLKDVMPLTPEKGFDSNFCVNQITEGSNTFVSRVVHPKSGRVMEVYSNQPGVQFYTSNNLPDDDRVKGKGGAVYKKHGALCLETQNYPNAMNTANFPNSILYPGKVYQHDMTFRFTVLNY